MQEKRLHCIILLDEAGKLFELALSACIAQHLCEVSSDLSDTQIGFREGCSTVDDMMLLRAVSEDAVSCGGAILVVSYDYVILFSPVHRPVKIAATTALLKKTKTSTKK